jgi:hypothetical protein
MEVRILLCLFANNFTLSVTLIRWYALLLYKTQVFTFYRSKPLFIYEAYYDCKVINFIRNSFLYKILFFFTRGCSPRCNSNIQKLTFFRKRHMTHVCNITLKYITFTFVFFSYFSNELQFYKGSLIIFILHNKIDKNWKRYKKFNRTKIVNTFFESENNKRNRHSFKLVIFVK